MASCVPQTMGNDFLCEHRKANFEPDTSYSAQIKAHTTIGILETMALCALHALQLSNSHPFFRYPLIHNGPNPALFFWSGRPLH